MTLKRIHQNSKLLIVKPYVVRVHHAGTGYDLDYMEFRKILRMCQNIASSTWGYSNPETETRYSGELKAVTSVSFQPQNIFLDPYVVEMISYWAFSSEEDALQFRLTLGDKATRVHMWPSQIAFTIYEME